MLKKNYTLLHALITGVIFALSLLFCGAASAAIAEDKNTAVIFMYQRIGEDAIPDGNISLDQFRQHINELKKGGYSVLPLEKIIAGLKNGGHLPPKTVGITFDGAYQATLTNAVPILEEAQMPFTIFFASDMIDSNAPGATTWKQLKKLHKDSNASLGLLPANYEHMVNQTAEQNATLINRAVSRYREVLNEEPLFFAYPYGEFSNSLKKQLGNYKFKAVFGQHSGVVHGGSDFMSLPRFTMTDEFGDLDRFMLTANALPLPVSDLVPDDEVLSQNPPVIGFTVTPEITNLSKLSCFASSLGKLSLGRIGNNRVEIRPEKAFTDRRTRINCTLPYETVAPGEALRWRWFGMLLIAPVQEEDNTAPSSPEDVQSGDEEDDQPGNQ